MGIDRLSPEEELLRILRQPKSTQQLCDQMPGSWRDTEQLLYELRDEGAIAYANGEWYVVHSGRLPRRKPAKPEDPRQGKLFE